MKYAIFGLYTDRLNPKHVFFYVYCNNKAEVKEFYNNRPYLDVVKRWFVRYTPNNFLSEEEKQTIKKELGLK